MDIIYSVILLMYMGYYIYIYSDDLLLFCIYLSLLEEVVLLQCNVNIYLLVIEKKYVVMELLPWKEMKMKKTERSMIKVV